MHNNEFTRLSGNNHPLVATGCCGVGGGGDKIKTPFALKI